MTPADLLDRIQSETARADRERARRIAAECWAAEVEDRIAIAAVCELLAAWGRFVTVNNLHCSIAHLSAQNAEYAANAHRWGNDVNARIALAAALPMLGAREGESLLDVAHRVVRERSEIRSQIAAPKRRARKRQCPDCDRWSARNRELEERLETIRRAAK